MSLYRCITTSTRGHGTVDEGDNQHGRDEAQRHVADGVLGLLGHGGHHVEPRVGPVHDGRGAKGASRAEGEEDGARLAGSKCENPTASTTAMMAMPTTDAIELMVRAPDTASAEVVHRTTTAIESSRLKPSRARGCGARYELVQRADAVMHACLRASVHVPCIVRARLMLACVPLPFGVTTMSLVVTGDGDSRSFLSCSDSQDGNEVPSRDGAAAVDGGPPPLSSHRPLLISKPKIKRGASNGAHARRLRRHGVLGGGAAADGPTRRAGATAERDDVRDRRAMANTFAHGRQGAAVGGIIFQSRNDIADPC